ncbi:GerMN domain-containing protein [Aeromicrobium sp.]|uniref:GerMN domain-containing protein n=1 Tax=Aeromicrobium sp. TaxID=1871063 RepID=UPI0025C388CC|nr:GerMN domain-containing protein [Aeromicrobium sp.]MCK5892661.1 GerMN domain-containing protein [Aeromicrobium sp.]
MRRVAMVLVAALVLPGCASLPTATDVERASDVEVGSDLITYQPAPPAPGAEPQEIVAGFLDAMLAYPVSSGTASAYLSSDAAAEWAAGDGVRIYRSPVIQVRETGETTTLVDLDLQESGRLDRNGHFIAAQGSASFALELVLDDGDWRIANPPAGLAVTQGYFETYYEALDVFLFDVRGEQLVADPVHLQVGERLATSLTAALVAGGPPRVAGETRTYVPDPSDWNPAVTVAQGRATVEFSTSLTTLDLEVRRRLSAQVVRTLSQVPGVSVVRIVGSDGPLVAGGTADQPVSAWARFDPPPATGRAGAVVDDVVSTLDGQVASPVAGVPDDLAATASLVAARPGAWATVSDQGVLRVVRAEGERVDQTVDVVSISWDVQGRLWVADRPQGLLRVRLMTEDGVTPVPVASALDGVTSFALEPGGTRYAVTRQSGDVLAGAVTSADPGSVPQLAVPAQIARDVVNPAAVVWLAATVIAVVGDGETGRQVYRASIDGSPSDATAGTAPRLPNVAITALAAGSGDDPDLYVTDDRARLWYLPAGGSWRLLGVTARGLTSGR